MKRLYMTVAAIALALAGPAVFAAEYAGVVKIAKGTVSADRAGQQVPLTTGARVEQGDRIITGSDGHVGITMRDDTTLTLGPRSELTLDKYAFDPKTHEGSFFASLGKGVLAVVSGLIPKKSPDDFTVKTRISTMGVRGTEFIVEARE